MGNVLRIIAAVAGVVAVGAAAGCSASGQDGGKPGGTLVSDGTLTLGISVDPGNLDPQKSLVNTNVAIAALAYDSPVSLDHANPATSGRRDILEVEPRTDVDAHRPQGRHLFRRQRDGRHERST